MKEPELDLEIRDIYIIHISTGPQKIKNGWFSIWFEDFKDVKIQI